MCKFCPDYPIELANQVCPFIKAVKVEKSLTTPERVANLYSIIGHKREDLAIYKMAYEDYTEKSKKAFNLIQKRKSEIEKLEHTLKTLEGLI